MIQRAILLSMLSLTIVVSSCKKLLEEEEETPTKSLMEGVWEVTEAYDENDSLITDGLAYPVTAFYLSSDNTILSTGGPMFMYIVYGGSNYVSVASQIDQVFNYTSLDFNGGEFFIDGGVQERFTIEMKLEGLPGQKALTTLLDLIGIGNDYLDVVVYHKFMDVEVSFEQNDDVMVWEFDNTTTAIYNTKDNYGNYVSWEGWQTDNFSKCRFKLKRSVKDLKDVVEDAI